MATLSQQEQRRLQIVIEMLSSVPQLPLADDVIARIAPVAQSSGFLTVPQFFNAAKDSPISTLLEFLYYIGQGDASPGVPPASPSGLDINDTSVIGDVLIEWTNNSTDATAVEIWRSDNGAAPTLLASLSPNAISYHDTSPLSEYTEYAVRAVNANGGSPFSNSRGVGDNLGDLGLAVYDFPRMVLHFNMLALTGGGETELNAPLLRKIVAGGISIDAPLTMLDLSSLRETFTGVSITNSDLTSIILPAYSLMVFDGSLIFSHNASLTTLSVPLLTVINGDLTGTNCPALQTVEFTTLAATVGSINFSSNITVQQMDFGALVDVGGSFDLSGLSALTTFDVSALTTVGGVLRFTNFSSLGALDLGNLVTVGNECLLSNGAMATIDFSALQTTGSDIFTNDTPNIVSLSFPSLTSAAGLQFYNCFALTSLDMPIFIYPDGSDIQCNGDQLDAASVNQILARGVASNVTFCEFALAGGSNAAPTGQGVIDKATLLGQGNTVTTN